jgi:hypothetical protein
VLKTTKFFEYKKPSSLQNRELLKKAKNLRVEDNFNYKKRKLWSKLHFNKHLSNFTQKTDYLSKKWPKSNIYLKFHYSKSSQEHKQQKNHSNLTIKARKNARCSTVNASSRSRKTCNCWRIPSSCAFNSAFSFARPSSNWEEKSVWFWLDWLLLNEGWNFWILMLFY